MALVDMLRGLLIALRRHLGRIGSARNAARTKLLPLDVVLGEIRLNAIRLAVPLHACLLRTRPVNVGIEASFLGEEPKLRNAAADEAFCSKVDRHLAETNAVV